MATPTESGLTPELRQHYVERLHVYSEKHPSTVVRHLATLLTEQLTSVPQVNANFSCESNGVLGTTEAPVKNVCREDDGSITVVINYWPKD